MKAAQESANKKDPNLRAENEKKAFDARVQTISHFTDSQMNIFKEEDKIKI